MAERERVRLGAGVSIYREYEAWSLEVCRDHKRVRKSLKTRDRGEAIMKAGALLREIEARKAEVDWLPKVHRVAEFLSGAESVGLRYHNPTDPADLFNGRTFDDIAAGSIDRLKSLAHEGFDLEAKIERAVRAATGKSEVKAVECEATLDGYRKFLLGHKGDCEDHVDNVLSQLRRFFASAKVKFTHELTAAHVEDYIASCVGQEGSTRKHKLGIIRAWLEWAKRQKYIETNVAEEVPPPKVFAPDITATAPRSETPSKDPALSAPCTPARKVVMMRNSRIREVNHEVSESSLRCGAGDAGGLRACRCRLPGSVRGPLGGPGSEGEVGVHLRSDRRKPTL